MICIHSRRDFRPNNVNGCWNGANEVKYAAINAGPRFYNALTCTKHGARTKGLVVVAGPTSETGKILSVAKWVISRITRLSKLGIWILCGATIETRRAWRTPRLPLCVDTLVDPPIYGQNCSPGLPFPRSNGYALDPMSSPPALNIHHSASVFQPAWRQGRTKCASRTQRIPYLAPPSHLTGNLECGFWEFRFKASCWGDIGSAGQLAIWRLAEWGRLSLIWMAFTVTFHTLPPCGNWLRKHFQWV